MAQLSDELVVKEHDLELATIEVDKVKLKDFEFVVKVFLNTELFFTIYKFIIYLLISKLFSHLL